MKPEIAIKIQQMKKSEYENHEIISFIMGESDNPLGDVALFNSGKWVKFLPDIEDEFFTDTENNEPIDLGDIDLDSLFEEPQEHKPTALFTVPLPQRKNYIVNLLNRGYTPTLCQSDSKIPFLKQWQTTYFAEVKDEFIKKMESERYEFNFGILTGVPKYGNVSVIDFDTKQFTEPEQTKLINWIESLIHTEYIQTLIQSKKVFIEKSVNNGYHFVVSINDNTERKGLKLLDYNGTLKPNLLIKEAHKGIGEFIETRGKKQHFVSYPSNGYTKLYNVLWELNKMSTAEYEDFTKYILDHFLNVDTNFSRANTTNVVTPNNNNGSKTVTKSQVNDNLDKDHKELLSYQKRFSESLKDIEILKKLLGDNGYILLSDTTNRIDYIHPLSSKAESNFTVFPDTHSITNFSDNNQDFPNNNPEKDFATYGSLRACYILWKKLNPQSDLNQFYNYLESQFQIKLILNATEIMKLVSRKQETGVNSEMFVNDFYCSSTSYYQVSLIQDDLELIPKNLNQIANLVNITNAKEFDIMRVALDKKQIYIPKLVRNCVYTIDQYPDKYNFDLGKNKVDIFVPTTLNETTKNNDLWEWYLEDRFKEDKGFIKQWISAYCYYSEYEFLNDIEPQRLSSLVLLGERGVGKGTFANLIKDIFGMNHYSLLNPDKATSRFDTWKGKKLAFIDESTEKQKNYTPKIYSTMKEVNGDPYVNVEGKGENQKLIKNQCTFIVASNDATPFFTVFSEIPTNPDTNQFYVAEYELSDKYNPKIVKQLRDSFLHYIKTELKEVFYNEVVPSINSDRNIRWVVSTPISERQKLMFASSKTTNDHTIEHVVRDIADNKLKWLTKDNLREYAEEHETKSDYILNLLVERKLVNRLAESRKIKNELGQLKGTTVYVVNPDTVTKLIKKYEIKIDTPNESVKLI